MPLVSCRGSTFGREVVLCTPTFLAITCKFRSGCTSPGRWIYSVTTSLTDRISVIKSSLLTVRNVQNQVIQIFVTPLLITRIAVYLQDWCRETNASFQFSLPHGKLFILVGFVAAVFPKLTVRVVVGDLRSEFISIYSDIRILPSCMRGPKI